MGDFINGIKTAYTKTTSFVKNIFKTLKLLATPIGQAIGILVLVAFLVVTVYVIEETVQHAVGLWFWDDYAGISTYDDFDTIVGELAYTGYDSFISEEKWQEYSAFEYAVLMDVAEHMYEYQDYVTELKAPNGETYETSAVIPEGIVHTTYDAANPTGGSSGDDNSWWQMAVYNAQQGNPPAGSTLKQEDLEKPGGNRDVVTPRLIYEKASHEYEDDAISLMPYLVVVREDIELNYFIQGLDQSTWEKYKNKNLQEIDPVDLYNNMNTLAPVKFSPILNKYNYNMPSSAYKEDIEEYLKENNGEEGIGVGVEDERNYIFAEDDYDPDSIYYIEQETDIVYKIPLKVLVNRYLPKSTLLTAWYMLKTDDKDSNFKIDDMMQEIKDIYNAACYTNGDGAIEEIKITGKKDENGEVTSNGDKIGTVLRTVPEDGFEDATVSSVQYDELGAVKRNDSGDAIMGTKNITYATSNYRTFIYFEQFGLETSRYEKYKAYWGPSGDNAPHSGDEARPDHISPTATHLTREQVNFVRTLNLTLKEIEVIYESGEEGIIDLSTKFKPTYSHIDEPYPELFEKAKSEYLFGGKRITQSEPYSFMKDVVSKAESKMGGGIGGEPGTDGVGLINELYILAESGNSDELMEKYGDPTKIDPDEIEYKLAEDFRYYNQDYNIKQNMPHWYDLQDYDDYNEKQIKLEESYLKAFYEVYTAPSRDLEMKEMLLKELKEQGYEVTEVISFGKAESDVEYTHDASADLYGFESPSDGKHVGDMKEVANGAYKINYYWDAVYVIQERQLQMRQKIYHRRMPAVLVKYSDSWAKFTEYDNYVLQHSLDYRNHVFLIPDSITSLGLEKMQLNEKSSYRVSTFEKYFNKIEDNGEAGVKEGDVLDMLIQWEDYANKGGDETAYAYMRDLYKLAIFIRDKGNMLESAYSYLHIPSTISNYDDETVQKIFWLERLGVSQGDDELTEEEQGQMRTKAVDTKWQNVEYDEYAECIYDSGDGEDAKVYALFPFGAPVVRTYYMLQGWNNIISNGFKGDHAAADMYSRSLAEAILYRTSNVGKHIYFYELNRLTLWYMRNGNTKQDAFMLAEKELNRTLQEYALNSPIVAIAPGYVTKVDYDARSGFYVAIAHDSGENSSPQITSFYCHMKRWPLVEVGEVVGAGTILGYEGTTGRSTGYHLHLEIEAGGASVNPEEYTLPAFSPFYYDIKAAAVLEEDSSLALGTEYYTLERTILLDDGLFNSNNVINGMTLEDGTVINYTGRRPRTEPYTSGETYQGSAYSAVWGNNVPTKELAGSLGEIIDLNLLNQSVEFEPTSGDNGDGGQLTYSMEDDVTANPDCFSGDKPFFTDRLKWPKWFAVEMAEYKSERVVPYYNGPESPTDAIDTEEALKDLQSMQDSLKKAGYYQKAGVRFEEAGYGTYSDLFVKVVKTMQQELIDQGYQKYGVSVNGNLDRKTIAAYNTMMQYTSEENQFAMAEKTAYNSGVDLSTESALIWAIITVENEGGLHSYLALKEADDESEAVELKYNFYTKQFNRGQGLMQIIPTLAIERYKEDKVESGDAVLFIRQPMRSTNIGMEILKEDMMWAYDNFSGDIENEKNKYLYSSGAGGSGFWYEEVVEKSKEDKTRWCDVENMDRLMLYAIGSRMYELRLSGLEEEQLHDTIKDEVADILAEPEGYPRSVLEAVRDYILENKSGGASAS